MLRKGRSSCLLIANLSDRVQSVQVKGLQTEAAAWELNEKTAELAGKDPDTFRARVGDRRQLGKPIALSPYAVLQLVF